MQVVLTKLKGRFAARLQDADRNDISQVIELTKSEFNFLRNLLLRTCQHCTKETDGANICIRVVLSLPATPPAGNLKPYSYPAFRGLYAAFDGGPEGQWKQEIARLKEQLQQFEEDIKQYEDNEHLSDEDTKTYWLLDDSVQAIQNDIYELETLKPINP